MQIQQTTIESKGWIYSFPRLYPLEAALLCSIVPTLDGTFLVIFCWSLPSASSRQELFLPHTPTPPPHPSISDVAAPRSLPPHLDVVATSEASRDCKHAIIPAFVFAARARFLQRASINCLIPHLVLNGPLILKGHIDWFVFLPSAYVCVCMCVCGVCVVGIVNRSAIRCLPQ